MTSNETQTKMASTSPAAAPSQQRQTALALVAAFNRMDIDTIISLRHADCMRHIRPAALQIPAQNNSAYRQSLEQLKPIFQNFRLVANDLLEDREARRICMYLTANADTAAGEYVNEYMWTLDFDVEGRKIVNWMEFVDSSVNEHFWPKLREAMRVHREKTAGD